MKIQDVADLAKFKILTKKESNKIKGGVGQGGRDDDLDMID